MEGERERALAWRKGENVDTNRRTDGWMFQSKRQNRGTVPSMHFIGADGSKT